MSKIKINKNAFVYPMPMVIVGAIVNGKANFMPVGWVTRVNNIPPMIGVAMNKAHYTSAGIHEQKVFSINIPDISLITKTDYCGLVSGTKTDKSIIFDIFNGEVTSAPMINDCPVTMECKLIETVSLPTNELFIGEIITAYCDENVAVDGKPDIAKIKPFTLTMPDNNYWRVGELLGKAWKLGKNYLQKDK